MIADHIRALSFAIADGIIPSNEGRGYVLRRILRRAVRYGRSLGFHEPFFFKLVDVVAKTMGDVFPEVRAKQKTIEETIRREEESFNKTLDRGMTMFDDAACGYSASRTARARLIRVTSKPGCSVHADPNARGVRQQVRKVEFKGAYLVERFVFELYDTYGFPLDLTELMARERGFPSTCEVSKA